MPPRSQGEPRPVSDPSSDSASAKPMLMPAPIDAGKADQKGLPILMGGEGGREQRRQRRNRAVHQAGEAGLHILQDKHALARPVLRRAHVRAEDGRPSVGMRDARGPFPSRQDRRAACAYADILGVLRGLA